MTDYTYPSIYFSYLFFTISLGVAVYFCFRSFRDGYFGKDSEEVKYRVLQDQDGKD